VKLRKQFIITMPLFGLVLVIIALSAVITNRWAAKISDQEEIASRIAQGASELSYLFTDYLIYRESQQLSRCRSRLASLSAQVVGLLVVSREQQTFVRNIQANEESLKEVFDGIASSLSDTSRDQTALDPAFLQISWSRMAIQSQGLVSDASRLSQMLRAEVDQLRYVRDILMFVMLGVFIAFLLSNYVLTFRRTLKSIAVLQAGAAVIGSGNLDYRIKEDRNDEIDDLSRAFNRMTADLKVVTASKADLEMEIVERKRAEEALRETHDRALWLARFPDENPNPVVRVSADRTVLYCNPSAVELHEWRCAIGRPMDERLLPLVSLAMAEGEERSQDVEIGRRFYSVWVAPFPEEGYANVYGRDITERKQAEEELRVAYSRLQTFFDHRIGGIGIVIANARGDILQANDYYLSILGTTRKELLSGQVDWRRMTPPEWLPADETALAQLREQGVCDTYEKEYVRRDGVRVPVLITDAMMPGDTGDILAFVLDISERKAAEEALRQSEQRYKFLHAELELRVQERTAELERRNRELQEFGFVASHDLSEPLRKIQTFGSLLEERSADRLGEQGRDYISRMTGAANRMQELLHALLSYSRVDAKGQEFRPAKLDEIVRDAVTDLEVAIQTIGARVEIGELPIANGDPYQLRQLFHNLIANAVKYHRSEVTPSIKISGEVSEGLCHISISDNGIGFDEKYLNKIFQPFQRLHGRNEYLGTGIGLAICKKIVERHRGTITAISTPGKGSTFIITLPVDGTKAANKPE
jgi:PAS domain S-box-containing protein